MEGIRIQDKQQSVSLLSMKQKKEQPHMQPHKVAISSQVAKVAKIFLLGDDRLSPQIQVGYFTTF